MCHYFVTFLFASTHSPVPLTRFRILFPVFILLYDLIQGNTLTDDVFHNCHLVLFKMDFLRVTIIFPFRSFLSSILTPSILPSTPYHVSSTDHKHCVRRWYWAIFLNDSDYESAPSSPRTWFETPPSSPSKCTAGSAITTPGSIGRI